MYVNVEDFWGYFIAVL